METHRHCMGCGVNIPPSETFCSQKCNDSFVKRQKKLRKSQRIMLVVLIAIFIIMLIMKIVKGI